jgi:hypothetical protein
MEVIGWTIEISVRDVVLGFLLMIDGSLYCDRNL